MYIFKEHLLACCPFTVIYSPSYHLGRPLLSLSVTSVLAYVRIQSGYKVGNRSQCSPYSLGCGTEIRAPVPKSGGNNSDVRNLAPRTLLNGCRAVSQSAT